MINRKKNKMQKYCIPIFFRNVTVFFSNINLNGQNDLGPGFKEVRKKN